MFARRTTEGGRIQDNVRAAVIGTFVLFAMTGISHAGTLYAWPDPANSPSPVFPAGIHGSLYNDEAISLPDGLPIKREGSAAFDASVRGQIGGNTTTLPTEEREVPLSPTSIPLPSALWAALSALPLLFFGRRVRRFLR